MVLVMKSISVMMNVQTHLNLQFTQQREMSTPYYKWIDLNCEDIKSQKVNFINLINIYK